MPARRSPKVTLTLPPETLAILDELAVADALPGRAPNRSDEVARLAVAEKERRQKKERRTA